MVEVRVFAATGMLGSGGLISGVAFPFTPPETEKGPVCRFNLNDIVLPENPLEMFRTEMLEV